MLSVPAVNLLLLLGHFASAVAGLDIRDVAGHGPAALKLHLLRQRQRGPEQANAYSSPAQHPLSHSRTAEFPPRFFSQPLDHFASTGHTFLQRYWVSTRHYKPGGPVFVLDGGETSGEGRLPFLDTGILDILAGATGGLGIVLEHRYYGTSVPVANLSTDSLRWLNNAQAAADSANFIANVKIEGLNETITAPGRPWIYYGGSYAGARAAHMRILYPSLVYGAIASSAVTHAALYNWEYYDIIRNYTAAPCRRVIEHSAAVVDRLLARYLTRGWIKGLFGLRGLQLDQDFVTVLQNPLGTWQEKNWDPAVGTTGFDDFCNALTHKKPELWGIDDVRTLSVEELVALSGNASDLAHLAAKDLKHEEFHYGLFNYARYIRKNIVSQCQDNNVEACFGTTDPTFFQNTDLTATWRLWNFQVCTEWGYFITAPPDPKHPTLVSRLLDLDYASKTCRLAYPPGEHFIVPNWPNVTAVNALGDFAITADRLAIVDGENPWRPMTPHSDYAKPRKDTTPRPFKLIPGGVHHWDENGLLDREAEPDAIQTIHHEEVEFVKAWLNDWKGVAS